MNGYLKKRNEINQSFLDAGEQLGVQKMWDYMQLALRDPKVMGKDTFGPERLKKLFKAMQELASEYHTAFTDDKEADYYQEKLDKQLKPPGLQCILNLSQIHACVASLSSCFSG